MSVSVPLAVSELARALRTLSPALITGYPGYHAHELMALVDAGPPSPNERTAFAVAWGAAAAAAPSVVVMKNVGLSDALDPLVNAAYLMTQAPMLVVCFDDTAVEGSQLYLRTDLYLELCGGVCVSPACIADVFEATRLAWALSERAGRPALLRLTSDLLRGGSDVVKLSDEGARPQRVGWVRSPELQVAHPINARSNYRRSAALWASLRCDVSRPDVQVSGPPELTQALSEGPFIVNDRYEPLFAPLRARGGLIVGDLGTSTMDSARSVDLCLCLGAAVSVGVGASVAASAREVTSVIGDGGLLHSGGAGLDEAEARGVNLLVVVIENGGSATTGGQRIPGSLSRLYDGRKVASASLSEPEEIVTVLSRLRRSSGLKILRLMCEEP